MREMRIVLRREFVERVRSRSFLVSTILTPLFLSLFAIGPALTGGMRQARVHRIAVVDESGRVGHAVIDILASEAARDAADQLIPLRLARASPSAIDSLTAQVQDGRIDGFLRIPGNVIERGDVDLRTASGVSRRITARIEDAVTTAVRAERLEGSGLHPRELGAIIAPVRMKVQEIGRARGELHGDEAGLIFSLLVGFFLYFTILLYGSQVMHSVQEEKAGRIAEVLVASVRPGQLMLGKVFGVGAAALLQVVIWGLFAWLAFGVEERLVALGVPADALQPLTAGASGTALVSALLYMILGFFLYATLFAAVGAAAASTEDAQRFTFPLVLPLFVPMFLAGAIVDAPRGGTAIALSWIPFTAPLVMPMRIGAGGALPVEIGGTLCMLAASTVAIGWVAGKVYRVGILSTGARPSIRELARWARSA